MSSGPVFGSVPVPVRTSPRFSPSTQMTAALMLASTRPALVSAGMQTAAAISAKSPASSREMAPPLVPAADAAARSADASQPGSPPASPAMAALSAPGARTGACSRKKAELPHSTTQRKRDPRGPVTLPAATLPAAVSSPAGLFPRAGQSTTARTT